MGQPDDAIEAFRRALSIEPNEKPWLHSLARALRLAGDPDEALAVLQQALEHGEDGEVLATMGQVLAELGSPDALAVLERAIDVEPTAGAFASIASVLIAEDDASAASGSGRRPGAVPGRARAPRAPGVRPHPPEERDSRWRTSTLDRSSPPDARRLQMRALILNRTGDPKRRSRRSAPPLAAFLGPW